MQNATFDRFDAIHTERVWDGKENQKMYQKECQTEKEAKTKKVRTVAAQR
jgi:hypothetical protein